MFSHLLANNEFVPLAARMRPKTLEDFVGQEHIIGQESTLIKSIQSGQLPSIILWGPPGSGKTSLAWLLSNLTSHYFESISAVVSGVGDLRKIVNTARERLDSIPQQTILFVDEIHRFNKAQQDAILPYVEDGTVIFIGATTENPSFEVISPLLSRSITYVLNPLEDKHIQQIILQAISDSVNGLGEKNISVNPDSLQHIVAISNGDARTALNILEISASATNKKCNAKFFCSA